jgi:hypothetical protein
MQIRERVDDVLYPKAARLHVWPTPSISSQLDFHVKRKDASDGHEFRIQEQKDDSTQVRRFGASVVCGIRICG